MNTDSKSNNVLPKIVWAINPFTTDKEIIRNSAKYLNALTRQNPARIEPVYAWTGQNLVAFTASYPDFMKLTQAKGQQILRDALSSIIVPGLMPFKLITAAMQITREESHALLSYARESGAKMIAVSSHGKKGLKRFFLGSFAETLTLQSDLPLFIIKPNKVPVPRIKSVLFPTDFSSGSKKAFGSLLDFAEEHRCHITLFHQVGSGGAPLFNFDLGVTFYAFHEEALRAERAAHEKVAESLVSEARKRGVLVDVVFEVSRGKKLSDAILRQAKKGHTMLAIASQSGTVTASLLGSTCRNVIRHSELPVWVIHPVRPAKRNNNSKKENKKTGKPRAEKKPDTKLNQGLGESLDKSLLLT